MKRLFLLVFVVCTHPLHSTSIASKNNPNTDNQERISFYGTLTTHQGQKDTVEHILIEGKHTNIAMYDAPIKHAKKTFNEKTKQAEILLKENPIQNFVKSPIDLNKISALKVPEPNTIWVYQKDKEYQRIEFTLVHIFTKENSTPKEYLIEHKTHLSCISTTEKESQKKDVPLTAIDTLTVEGYTYTVTQTTQQNTTDCPR